MLPRLSTSSTSREAPVQQLRPEKKPDLPGYWSATQKLCTKMAQQVRSWRPSILCKVPLVPDAP